MINFNAMSDGISGSCRFEVYRDEQIRVSSTQFCDGAWSWRLCFPSGKILAQSRAYEREEDCRTALSYVLCHADGAKSGAAAGGSAMKQVEIIARFLCQFSGEDPDASMYPAMGFQPLEAEERTAKDNSPRWYGFIRPAEELWKLLQSEN